MRIALTVGRLERVGGVERVASALAEAYAGLGHEVTVVAEGGEPSLLALHRWQRAWAPRRPAWLRAPILMANASKALRGLKADWVHVQGTSAWGGDLLSFHSVHPAWWALACEEARGRPWLELARRLHPFHHTSSALERAQVRGWRGRFHACSPATAAEAAWVHGLPPEAVVGWPWGQDLEGFAPDLEAGLAWRKRLGLPEGAVVLLVVANELRRKGLGPLLEAVAALGRPELQVVSQGWGAPQAFLALAERLGLKGRYHPLPSGDPRPAMQGSQLLVLASAYEGWGLVIPEALACGLPVLSTPVPAATALVRPEGNGWLLPPLAGAEALATGLEACLAPGKLARWAAAAPASVAGLSWPATARRLLAWGQGGEEAEAWAAGGDGALAPPRAWVDGAGRPLPTA